MPFKRGMDVSNFTPQPVAKSLLANNLAKPTYSPPISTCFINCNAFACAPVQPVQKVRHTTCPGIRAPEAPAPAGMDPAKVQAIHHAVEAVMMMEPVIAQLAQFSFSHTEMSAEEFNTFVQKTITTWEPLIKAAKVNG